MTTIAFLTRDLMFQSRVASLASEAKVRLVADRTVERLLAKFDSDADVRLVIVDLTLDSEQLEEDLAALKAHCPSALTIAYGPHVHEGKLQRASEAGFDQVMTRGQFDRSMSSLIMASAPSS